MENIRHPERAFTHAVAAPFIYAVFFPVVLLDIFVEIYHRVCFPIYHIPYVKRSDYIAIDHQRLSYLRWWEKFNCLYCSYVNGWLMYAKEIAGRTEAYWCGITHQKRRGLHLPENHRAYLPYGDAQALEDFKKNRPPM